jgi:hypothetical protein
MTRQKVEALLGPGGKEIEAWSVPTNAARIPVITGDRFFEWRHKDGQLIIVSFKEGAVFDKWFWEPMP